MKQNEGIPARCKKRGITSLYPRAVAFRADAWEIVMVIDEPTLADFDTDPPALVRSN